MGGWVLSCLLLAVEVVDMLLSLLADEVVGCAPGSLLALLVMGEPGVDMEKYVLISVSAWLSLDLHLIVCSCYVGYVLYHGV